MKIFEVLEQEDNEDWDDLYEMANIHSRYHGIQDVVIWVGLANKQHGLRIKVSNIKNKFDPNNCFVIQKPSLDYNPRKVANWIDTNKLELIQNWIKLNQALLYDYENGIIDDTGLFLNRISSVNS